MTRSGRGQLIAEVVVVAVVRVEFVVVQIEAGKELVFFKDEICDDGLLRSRTQIQGLQLLEPPHQKCKLCLKRRPTLAFIKGVQKGIRCRAPLRVAHLIARPEYGPVCFCPLGSALPQQCTGAIRKDWP